MHPPEIHRVTVVFKTHLDIGFTDLARNVVRQYFGSFIPAALNLARETRGSEERFVWTTGSWLIWRYLEEASAADRACMEEAILAGDIHWHALPFTTHTELMDASLFRLGLAFRDRLDTRFGRTTRAAKMTDVPGHTRAMVPLLAEAGVRLLHLGVNPASTVPDVPPAFLWRSGEAELVVLYDKIYGATTLLPGGTALSVNLTNDNMGPPSRAEIAAIYADLRERFPGAALTAGTLTDAADAAWEARAELPVVTSEIGDTWIHGLGTDPRKVAQFRTLSRLRQAFIAEGALAEGGDADLAFGEPLLLVAEHTWGMDTKSHLRDFRTYLPRTLERALTRPNFVAVAESWQEQRDYITQAVAALPPPLRKRAGAELDALVPRPQPAIPPGTRAAEGVSRLQIDHRDGSVVGYQLADPRWVKSGPGFRLGALAYQTFSAADYQRFYQQYNTNDFDWARKDFTKVGLPDSTLAAWYTPRPEQFRQDASGETTQIHLAFSRVACKLGAPREIIITYVALEDGLDLELQWTGKTANRLPEALWLGFAPVIPADATWTVTKLGQPIDTRDVVSLGARGLHASTGPVTTPGFSVHSLDAVLVAPGDPKLLNFDNDLPTPGQGIWFNLWNNAWNTNFPQWTAGDAKFRFELRWSD